MRLGGERARVEEEHAQVGERLRLSVLLLLLLLILFGLFGGLGEGDVVGREERPREGNALRGEVPPRVARELLCDVRAPADEPALERRAPRRIVLPPTPVLPYRHEPLARVHQRVAEPAPREAHRDLRPAALQPPVVVAPREQAHEHHPAAREAHVRVRADAGGGEGGGVVERGEGGVRGVAGEGGGGVADDEARAEEEVVDVVGEDAVDDADAVEVRELGLCFPGGLQGAWCVSESAYHPII